MRRTLMILTIFHLVLFTQNLYSQTIVPGGQVSGTWTLSGSPYLIQGGIMIANDSILTIEPGVSVIFQGSYLILVSGSLKAEGTNSDSITFTCSNSSIGWLGIRFDNTSNSNASSVFSHCIFEYGKATAAAPNNSGGAFYFNNYSNAIISNSRISDCYANSFGGGIYCNNGSAPTISGNKIIRNSCFGGGGGIYCYGNSHPLITDNIISNNSVTNGGGGGGGIYCYNYSSPYISNNIIKDNTSGRGGGIFIVDGAGTISKNIIANNQASNSIGGGGIYTSSGSSNEKITENIISNNIAMNSSGGGIYCSSESIIRNNVIVNNTADNNGGAIMLFSSSAEIINNSISNNSSLKGHSIYCENNSDPLIKNTIFFNNIAVEHIYLYDDSSDPSIFYCNLQGGIPGIGLNSNVFYLGTYSNIIDSDPIYTSGTVGSGFTIDGLAADWSIQNGSPCIDMGDPSGNYPLTDYAGNPRISNGIIDIGAYEVLSLGLDNLLQDTFVKIFPTPMTNYTILNFSELQSNITIDLIDISGKIVNTTQFTGKELIINRENILPGLYLIRIDKYEKNIITKKLLVL